MLIFLSSRFLIYILIYIIIFDYLSLYFLIYLPLYLCPLQPTYLKTLLASLLIYFLSDFYLPLYLFHSLSFSAFLLPGPQTGIKSEDWGEDQGEDESEDQGEDQSEDPGEDQSEDRGEHQGEDQNGNSDPAMSCSDCDPAMICLSVVIETPPIRLFQNDSRSASEPLRNLPPTCHCCLSAIIQVTEDITCTCSAPDIMCSETPRSSN